MYLAPHQHELRHRLLEPQRAVARPTRFTPLEKRARRPRRLLRALRARLV